MREFLILSALDLRSVLWRRERGEGKKDKERERDREREGGGVSEHVLIRFLLHHDGDSLQELICSVSEHPVMPAVPQQRPGGVRVQGLSYMQGLFHIS